MFIGWTSHIKDNKEKEQFQQSVYGSKRVLDRLKGIIDELEKGVDRTEKDAHIYENPSWAYLQAHWNGYKAALTAILKIVDLDQQQIPKEKQ